MNDQDLTKAQLNEVYLQRLRKLLELIEAEKIMRQGKVKHKEMSKCDGSDI